MSLFNYENDKVVSKFMRRVNSYGHRFELIKNRCEELQQLGVNLSLVPVQIAAILELERKLRKKLPDEYVAFLYYLGSGKINHRVYSPEEVWENYDHFRSIEQYHSNRFVQIENFKQLRKEHFEELSKIQKANNETCLIIQKLKEGAIPIMEMGCIGAVIMVIRGEMAGTVWEAACEGRYTIALEKPPLADEEDEFKPCTFIPWMEDKLKRELKFQQLRKGNVNSLMNREGETDAAGD